MSVAVLAIATAWELADLARAETNPRLQARAVREANALMRRARWIDACPTTSDPDAYDAWLEQNPRNAARGSAEAEATVLRAELRELRAALAKRDTTEAAR